MIIVFMGNALVIRYLRARNDNNLVRSYTEMWFCTDKGDTQCQNGVSELDYTLRTRGNEQRNAFGYIADDRIHVKVQQVTIKLQEKAKDTLVYEPTIYLDRNNDGEFDPRIDDKLAKAFFSGKKVIFEDLNYTIRNASNNDQQANLKTKFFIVNDQNIQEFTNLNIKEIEVQAVNLARKSEFINNVSAFADRSLFKYSEMIELSKQQFLALNEFMINEEGNKVVWPEDDYEITENMIIPKGLDVRIEAGTNIKIAKDRSVVSYSPIQFEGTAEKRISISNLNKQPYDTFGVIGKLGDDFPDVHINYTDFKGGSEAQINGAFISGMASFYRIPHVVIKNSSFTGGAADDGLNVKYSQVDVSDSLFVENSADAFDGDFITGVIYDNHFIDNGNDSLDFSGGNLVVRSNKVENSGDKCVSVGEATTVTITENILDGCNIGVQVKDRSQGLIYKNLIINNKTAGLDSYVKKFFFGTPSTKYYENVILDNEEDVIGLIPAQMLDDNYTKGDIKDYQNLEWLQDTIDRLQKF